MASDRIEVAFAIIGVIEVDTTTSNDLTFQDYHPDLELINEQDPMVGRPHVNWTKLYGGAEA